MPIELTSVAEQDRSPAGIGHWVHRIRATADRNSTADALEALQAALQEIERHLRNGLKVKEVTIRLTDATGTVQTEILAGRIDIAGLPVVGPRQAAVAAITSGAAGGAYTAAEQALLNELRQTVLDLVNRLQSHGLIA